LIALGPDAFGGKMDFIERIFHIAPDGGSGSFELGFVLGLIVIPLALAFWVRRRSCRPTGLLDPSVPDDTHRPHIDA
jgi:hypothetical protein